MSVIALLMEYLNVIGDSVTLDEIMAAGACEGASREEVSAALRELQNQNRVICAEEDGVAFYMANPEEVDGKEADHNLALRIARVLGGVVTSGDAPASSPIHWKFDQGLKIETDHYTLSLPNGYASFREGDRDFVGVAAKYRDVYAVNPDGVPVILYGGSMVPFAAPAEFQEPLVRDYVTCTLVKNAMEKSSDIAAMRSNLLAMRLFEAGNHVAFVAALHTGGGVSYQFTVPGKSSAKMIRVQTTDSPTSIFDEELAALMRWIGTMEWKDSHVRTPLNSPDLTRKPAAWTTAVQNAARDVGVYRKMLTEFYLDTHPEDSREAMFEGVRAQLRRAEELARRYMREVDDALKAMRGLSQANHAAVIKSFQELLPMTMQVDDDTISIPTDAEAQALLKAWKEAGARLAEEEREAKRLEAEREQKRREEERLKREREEQERIERKANAMAAAEKRRKELRDALGMMGASDGAFAYVKADGTVAAYRNIFMGFRPDDNSTNVSRFSNIKAVVCTMDGIVGLRSDGTCISTDPGKICYSHITEANSWSGIKALAAGDHHVVGQREDGSCVANSVKWNTGYGYHGQSNVQGWRGIQAIACGDYFTIGLRSDGTVVHAGQEDTKGVEQWKDIALIGAGGKSAVGVTRQGELRIAGNAEHTIAASAESIVQVLIFHGCVYALQADGKVFGGRRPIFKGNFRPIAENVIAMAEGESLYLLTEDGQILIREKGSSSMEIPDNLKLFDSFSRFIEEREAQIQRRREYRAANLCQHCGGEFKKKLFSCKCVQCGKPKDY